MVTSEKANSIGRDGGPFNGTGGQKRCKRHLKVLPPKSFESEVVPGKGGIQPYFKFCFE